MQATLAEKHQPKQKKGWLTNTALACLAVFAVGDIMGCAALGNSVDTLGNAAATQLTKGGLKLMGKDVACDFRSVNHSAYSPGAKNHSGTTTGNVCKEIPDADAMVKKVENQEAAYTARVQARMKRNAETLEMQREMTARFNAMKAEQKAVEVCQTREIKLLGEGKKMDPAEGCVVVLQTAKDKLANR